MINMQNFNNTQIPDRAGIATVSLTSTVIYDFDLHSCSKQQW